MNRERMLYLKLRARMDKLEAAEDRAFQRFMDGTGSAATAYSARSRVNRLGALLAQAENAVMDDDGNLPDGRIAS